MEHGSLPRVRSTLCCFSGCSCVWILPCLLFHPVCRAFNMPARPGSISRWRTLSRSGHGGHATPPSARSFSIPQVQGLSPITSENVWSRLLSPHRPRRHDLQLVNSCPRQALSVPLIRLLGVYSSLFVSSYHTNGSRSASC